MRALLLAATSLALAAVSAAAAERAPAAPQGHARPATQRTRAVTIDAVRGDQGTAQARTALRDALGRHLQRQGFGVVEGGKSVAYRLQPTLLLLDSGGGKDVEVKASLVALDRKGHVVAMVEGGARTRGATPATPMATVESQAIEAAARSLAEDLARRLRQSR